MLAVCAPKTIRFSVLWRSCIGVNRWGNGSAIAGPGGVTAPPPSLPQELGAHQVQVAAAPVLEQRDRVRTAAARRPPWQSWYRSARMSSRAIVPAARDGQVAVLDRGDLRVSTYARPAHGLVVGLAHRAGRRRRGRRGCRGAATAPRPAARPSSVAAEIVGRAHRGPGRRRARRRCPRGEVGQQAVAPRRAAVPEQHALERRPDRAVGADQVGGERARADHQERAGVGAGEQPGAEAGIGGGLAQVSAVPSITATGEPSRPRTARRPPGPRRAVREQRCRADRHRLDAERPAVAQAGSTRKPSPGPPGAQRRHEQRAADQGRRLAMRRGQRLDRRAIVEQAVDALRHRSCASVLAPSARCLPEGEHDSLRAGSQKPRQNGAALSSDTSG